MYRNFQNKKECVEFHKNGVVMFPRATSGHNKIACLMKIMKDAKNWMSSPGVLGSEEQYDDKFIAHNISLICYCRFLNKQRQTKISKTQFFFSDQGLGIMWFNVRKPFWQYLSYSQ